MHAAKEVIATKAAAGAAGPYSQAIKAGGFIFVSGMVARDPVTNMMIKGDIKAQTELTLKSIAAVLECAGSSMDKVVKTTVYIKNWDDFGAMNEVYAKFFPTAGPARSTVQVVLPGDMALLEIDAGAME